MTAPTAHPGALLESLEARLAARLAAGLNERAAEVPHDIAERLRISREQALRRARQRRLAPAVEPVVAASGHGGLRLGGGFWLGLASWMPLLVLVLGLVLIQQWTQREQLLATAEIDAMLLADDLPPAAWNDPGFREYLKAPVP